jgi:hypothetical protein
MKLAPLRFFGVEHVSSMLIAIDVLHVGRARSNVRSTCACASVWCSCRW